MSSLSSIFNHLVLPPKLPGQADPNSATIENGILLRFIHACNTLRNITRSESAEIWESMRRLLHACLRLNAGGRLEKASMLLEFEKIKPNDTLILYVVEQNAALLVRRNVSNGMDTVVFEAFEASASSEAVLAAENALQWDLPGRAAEIPFGEFMKESFRENLAAFLEEASMKSLERFRARSVKAKTSIGEARDTSNPFLITQLLMPLLEALGSSVDVPKSRKKVRDEVNIQNAGLPWRRSPFWLVLRVAAQRHLCAIFGDEIGRTSYKFAICTVLTKLLQDSTRELAPELTLLLRAKLCRRLAKMEMDRPLAASPIAICENLFTALAPYFEKIVKDVTIQIEIAWDNYKQTIKRPIPKLDFRADEKALHLSLPNSASYIHNVLTLRAMPRPLATPLLVLPASDEAMGKVRKFADRYFGIAELEQKITLESRRQSGIVGYHEDGCIQMADSIQNLFAVVDNAYEANPEQTSFFILTLFELWIQMDEYAVEACGLLAHYQPVFQPDILDALQLSELSDMQRLQRVQTYLNDRSKRCRLSHKTILSEPDKNGFATQYMTQSNSMRKLLERIESDSDTSREDKEFEWKKRCNEYDELSTKIAEGTCVCSVNPDGTRNVNGCTKCWRWRSRKRMAITIHEDFLPKDKAQAAAIVFDLYIPGYLAAYRNATWKIVSCLGHPSRPKSSRPPAMLLKDHTALWNYGRSSPNGIQLASTTKSFVQTHFKALKMMVDLSNVLFPSGLRLSYYDTESGIWLKELDKPLTFQHLTGVHCPRRLLSVMPTQEQPSSDADALSSYEAMANQTKCPSDMSVREFMSHQRLRSGHNRRWLVLLVELGASNLNFSSEDTMLIFSQLAIQAGPAQHCTGTLRDAHSIFQDRAFCDRLMEQIDVRLSSIGSNWREIYCMEMLLTLILRLHTLTDFPVCTAASGLLRSVREITSRWIFRLRSEVRNATGADAAGRASMYALWAALLCRRTFTIFAEAESPSVIDGEDLGLFVQASLALQENLADPEMLPKSLKNMLVRDFKMAYRIRSLILRSIESHPEILGNMIDKTWSDPDVPDMSTQRVFSSWQVLEFPSRMWIASVITVRTTNNTSFNQNVHYNFVEGQLLVNGKSLGRLPANIADSEDVKELFGNLHLLTYPSSLSGMSHALTGPIMGHWIHFGLRSSGRVVIQAVTKDGILELLPRGIFMGSHGSVDLPSSLIQDCVHWLNINKKVVDIRRKPAVWKTRRSDWTLDFSSRRAKRRNVFLVDPNSDLCWRVAGIFDHFEDPQRLTVFQPKRSSLSVEMRFLELSFRVDHKGMLRCQELDAVIDPNQDAGCFYGLTSKIVLRDAKNPEKRSIITAMGPLTCERHGIHVSVRAASGDQYGRFQIDDVLGRITCPHEPFLIYAKAQFHAFTSFVIPDPLTGRTGAHEAMHILTAASSAPWSPLGGSPISVLRQIKTLAPTREYYPKDKRRLQTITWNEKLTMNIQYDRYDYLVENILTKSNRLQAFDPANKSDIDVEFKSPSHLSRRGEAHRWLYEHWSHAWGSPPVSRKNKVYKPRDRDVDLPQATNVHRVVKLLRRQPFSLPPTKPLSAFLQDWQIIGGFQQTSEIAPTSFEFLDDIKISERWGQFVEFCRNSDAQNSYDLVFLLALMAFAPKPEMDMIYIFAAFGSVPKLKALPTPLSSSFTELKTHAWFTTDSILSSISNAYIGFIPTARKEKQNRRAREQHQKLCEAESKRLASFILDQWPNYEISLDGFDSTLVDVERAFKAITPEIERLRHNKELSEYAGKVQEILEHHIVARDECVPKPWSAKNANFFALHRDPTIPSLPEGMRIQNSKVYSSQTKSYFKSFLDQASAVVDQVFQQFSSKVLVPENDELSNILSAYTNSPDVLRQEYGNDLKQSLAALENCTRQATLQQMPPTPEAVKGQIVKARATLNKQIGYISEALSPKHGRLAWLKLANLWPCLTLVTLLELLRSNSPHHLEQTWIESLVTCGLLVTTLQRLRRIENAVLTGDQRISQEELRNVGHENWKPSEFPDWLLLEIDSNLLIRPEQIDVAHAIISPASGSNSVLQMNMGQGKTSCIMPMAAAVLGDRKNLSRLIVPKALLLQTAQTIQSRLGGLVGREVRHIPFFRHTSTLAIGIYSDLHKEILDCCGVVLTTPEHLLSYKLSGLQLLADSKLKEASSMVKIQSWLNEISRDVVDESDFSLAVKTQLIYPSGSQMAVDGGSHRWEITQMVLSLVADHLSDLQHYYPHGIEVVKRPQGFPMIYFPQKEAEDALQRWIINDVCDGRIPFLRLISPEESIDKIEMQRLLLEERLDHRLFNDITKIFADPEQASKNILILRGLLMNRILLLCLKKRWNVQYGLHPHRDPVAVPFEAKGVPSEQAEFGHPDVAILFTCLAFYYAGLTVAQFREGLQHVLNSDDPATEYDIWVSGCVTLPEALHHWNVINLDDQGQLEELWKHLRFSKEVLDHFMNNFVFPRHAKQFNLKIQASGWDLPLLSSSKSRKENYGPRTTGFSGTNDNRMILPLTIKQDDLPTLRQTNAEVLTYLLQVRNQSYNLAAIQGRRLTEEGLLQRIASFNIRILIDAGAYVLEMDNQSLVKAWLDINTQAKGAVYFGADNRAWFQYRKGRQSVPLVATPFVDQLDQCLIYLDEAHTRGIDLKLPQFARGALTLALGQTKDHTVQAAMRLRQLGSSQAVHFFAPPEVHQSILDVCKMGQRDTVNSTHVVKWLLEQTCCANEQLHNLFLAQGTDFCRRLNAQRENPEFLTNKSHREAYLNVIQSPERQALEQLYGSTKSNKANFLTDASSKEVKRFMDELDRQRQSANESGNAVHSSALEEVEQERLVEFQVEEVRQIQKPKRYNAHRFPGLHPTVSNFAKSGNMAGDGYVQAFKALSQTKIGQEHNVNPTSSLFFVSREFLRTVYLGKGRQSDEFLRPIEWILWAPQTQTGLVVIPEEAEKLIPLLRKEKLAVHLISYAAPITKYMLHFNKLTYYALPSLPADYKLPAWFLIELGIWAGRLYIDFQEYTSLRRYLENASKPGAVGSFTKNPISFLLDWLNLRCKGQDITHTPMGYICQGRSLNESHPFFLARRADNTIAIPSITGRRGNDEHETEDEDSDIEDHEDFGMEIGNLEAGFGNLDI